MSKKKFKSFDEDASKLTKVTEEQDNLKPDFIESLEKERKGKIISIDDVRIISYKLYDWLKSIARYGNVDRCMIIADRSKHSEKKVNILFYTFENSYSIIAKLPNDEKKTGYLGCVVSKRKPRVGEWWTRGNDLADGEFGDSTWKRIVNDIVGYEMKNLQIDKTKE